MIFNQKDNSQLHTEILPRRFDPNLESLRGIVALLVVCYHYTDPTYKPTGLGSYSAPGHLGVLVFFILSGYVIGLAYNDKPISFATIGTYLHKRFLRLYPIYVVCLLLAFLVATQPYPLKTILGNLTMTQVWLTPVVEENGPLWSLNFEVLFYLLFIPISIWRLNSLVLLVLSTLLGLASAYLYPRFGSPLLSSYAFGFSYWLIGLAMAKYLPSRNSPYSFSVMLSAVFLLLSIQRFNVLAIPMGQITHKLVGKSLLFDTAAGPWYQRIISYEDFAYLPFCLLLVFVFTNKRFKYDTYIIGLLMLLPGLTFNYILKQKQYDAILLLYCSFYLLSLGFYILRKQIENFSRLIVNKLLITGSFSYGLYLVHYPIWSALHRIDFYSGTTMTFLLRYALYLLVVCSLAYWLEKKYQPFIKRILV